MMRHRYVFIPVGDEELKQYHLTGNYSRSKVCESVRTNGYSSRCMQLFLMRTGFSFVDKALQDYSRSVVNWQSALDALPESDKKTRDQYTTGLEAAKAKIQQLQNASGPQSIVINVNEEGSLPWVVAKAMIPGLRARNDFKSSVSTRNCLAPS